MRIQPLLAAALALFAASTAQAIERYNSQAMSCASVQATIRADGAAIMRYASKSNPSLTLFDRYVSGFNLAESFYAASLVTYWKDIVIGDPLCRPYAK